MNYGNYGGRRAGYDTYGRGEYRGYDDYGRDEYGARGRDMRYRGHEHLDRMYDDYGRYMESRQRYGAGEETDKSFHYMVKALEDFIKVLHEEAETPQQKQMLNETLQRSMRYYFYNANSHNNFIDDCFPRAYSIVMDITWKEAYKELCKSAMEQGQMMDNAIFVRSFLDSKFKRIPYIETYIGEFVENHPIGKYLITTNNHITACVNGYVIDTWDCTDKKIEYIWLVN